MDKDEIISKAIKAFMDYQKTLLEDDPLVDAGQACSHFMAGYIRAVDMVENEETSKQD